MTHLTLLVQTAAQTPAPPVVTTRIGEPNAISVVFFFAFIAITLGITWWAARRTRTTEEFYAAGRTITPVQNGFALAGDYMSAASFLGIAGLVSTTGFDGLIYSTGWLVGWPVVLFLIAEPLRNLGKYTFADVVAARLRQTPVRIAAAIGTLATVIFYLIAQMVGAGGLIRLMFGLSYEAAIMIVGAAMLAYVLFGGMIATTWVQIVKAVLLLGGAALLAVMVLAKFGMNPLALFAAAAEQYGAGVLAPGKLVAAPLDADLARHGAHVRHGRTAAHPHALLHRARRARGPHVGVLRDGPHRLLLSDDVRARLRRDGARRARMRSGPWTRAATWRRRCWRRCWAARRSSDSSPRSPSRRFSPSWRASRCRARRRCRTTCGSTSSVTARRTRSEQMRVARGATVALGVIAMLLGILFKGQNVAFMVSLAFAIAASANFPALVLSIFWRRCTTAGIVSSMVIGTASTLLLIWLSPTIQVDILKHPGAWFPLKNPALVTIPLSFAIGVLVSLATRDDVAAGKFAAAERRMHVGEA